MDVVDGVIANLFKNSKKQPVILDANDPEYWICDYINQDIEKANAFVLEKLKGLNSRRDKLQFLYDCRTCVKYELTGTLAEYSQLCCPGRHWPPEIQENPNLMRVEQKKYAELLKQLPAIEKKLDKFDLTLKRIECAIDHFEDCKKLDCEESGGLKQTLTNNQCTLLFYFFFKSLGLSLKTDIDLSQLTKFIHLIYCKEFKKINNSDIYKRLRKAPNFVRDAELIKDLETIKPFFQKYGLTSIVRLIDGEMETARNEIKLTKNQ